MLAIRQAYLLGARHGRDDMIRHASKDEDYEELKTDFRSFGKLAFTQHMRRYVFESHRVLALKLSPELTRAYCDGYVSHAIPCIEQIIADKDN